MTQRLPVLAFAMFAALIAGWSPAARAADADAAFDKRLFGAPVAPDKSYACFVRRYDVKHLARHPSQTVSAMRLLVTAEPDAETKALNYAFQLRLNYRNRRGVFASSGECGRAESPDTGQFGCSVDCDGGGIGVALAKDDKSVLVKVGRIRVWRNNRPDEESAQSLVGGAGDRVFRLDRTSLDDCKSLVTDRKELAAIRHK